MESDASTCTGIADIHSQANSSLHGAKKSMWRMEFELALYQSILRFGDSRPFTGQDGESYGFELLGEIPVVAQWPPDCSTSGCIYLVKSSLESVYNPLN